MYAEGITFRCVYRGRLVRHREELRRDHGLLGGGRGGGGIVVDLTGDLPAGTSILRRLDHAYRMCRFSTFIDETISIRLLDEAMFIATE